MTQQMVPPALEVARLSVRFSRGGIFSRAAAALHAVQDVSFTIPRGSVLGVVGESGCGKTTLARAVMRLIPITAGEIRLDGTELTPLTGRRLRDARRGMQMVFQDPFASLNPRMTIEQIVREPLEIHEPRLRDAERIERVVEILGRVGLERDALSRRPHEFSGGQRQRIGIARALILRPKVVILDEPVSALDVSVQAQILNLLLELREVFQLSYLFIAHNLAVVRRICDHVAVMYLGRIVETGPASAVLDTPQHPYTVALRSAAPDLDTAADRVMRLRLTGETASPWNPPAGCALHPRCPFASQLCRQQQPPLVAKEPGEPAHRCACHHPDAAEATPLSQA